MPVILATRFPGLLDANVSLYAFLVIASGTLSCVAGGYWSLRRGSAAVAFGMLLVSGLFCLLSPLLFALPAVLFLPLLLLWGMAVIGDSPQFSTLVARNAPPESRGSALTIVNSLGFAVTIVSIQALNYLLRAWDPAYIYLILAAGPAVGLWSTRRLLRKA